MDNPKYTITPIKICAEFTVEDIIRAKDHPSLIDRKIEAIRRLVEKEHADRYRLLGTD